MGQKTLPPWLKVRLPHGEAYRRVRGEARGDELHTVCEEARCPNLAECWGGGTATFMVLGETCTRGCRFCSVATARRPAPPDPEEPARLARTIERLKLKYAVITTVCRDDLPDQGAGHIAACVAALRKRCPELLCEFLLQDFRGDKDCLRTVAGAAPDVLGHNIETVERLTHPVRDAKAGYRQSLEVLAELKRLAPRRLTKSSLQLGLGERDAEVRDSLRHLREAGVDIVTLGQYLRPSQQPRHLPVAQYVHPERFAEWEQAARDLGFRHAAAGPLVRSSYRAGELFVAGHLREQCTQ